MTFCDAATASIDWRYWLNASPDELVHRIGAYLEKTRARVNRLKTSTGRRTFSSLLLGLEDSLYELDTALACIRYIESVQTTADIRNAYNRATPPAGSFYSALGLDQEVWDISAEYARSEEGLNLTGERARHLQTFLYSLAIHGANLHIDDRSRLTDLGIELEQMTTEFSENVLDANNEYALSISQLSQLDGLPPETINRLANEAARRGNSGWTITLNTADYVDVMAYATDAKLREEIYRVYSTRAVEKNTTLIGHILRTRELKAHLLGFQNFADLALADRMLRTGDQAISFINILVDQLSPSFLEENRVLERFAGMPLNPWDISFWAERLRRRKYHVSEDLLRPFFPLDQVLSAAFEVAGRLFGIKLERTSVESYRADVRHYRVRNRDGKVIAGLYCDLFPHNSKRGGAWFETLVSSCSRDAIPLICSICANLSPPKYGEPSLLSPREVETVFFMFGYFLHSAFSDVESRTLSGTSVAWDFVSFVSSIFEAFCWEPEVVELYARHWQTGVPVDPGAIAEMRRTQRFRVANQQMRQLGFGMVDLKLHTEYEARRHGSPIDYSESILQAYTPAPLPKYHAMAAAFTHLFGSPVGYAGGYYSYKWSEMLAALALRQFRKNGIMNPQTGRRLVDCVLSRGNTIDPIQQFEAFTGSPFDAERVARTFVEDTLGQDQSAFSHHCDDDNLSAFFENRRGEDG